jgi:predicted transcriptional regulator
MNAFKNSKDIIMGYELWKSPTTGIRRNGTTFKELQSIFIENITTKFFFEPIYSCRLKDDSLYVKEALEMREFDVVGVIDDENHIIGFAERSDLKEGHIEYFRKDISLDRIISDSTPISSLLNILIKSPFAFVLNENNITGIVTRADINKPIVRIYLFGIISLFELHLNFWIRKYFKNESWQDRINERRLIEANEIYDIRKGKNEDLSLLECLQFCDKKTILLSTGEFLDQFGFSKSKFKKLLDDIEIIRNELAHSQNSIVSNLEWIEFVLTISCSEDFL